MHSKVTGGGLTFMVWVKETLTADKLRLVSRLPSVCTMARGRTPMMTSLSTCGEKGGDQ
jgi:hypothetical protein